MNGKYSILHSFCFAEFLAYYYLDTKSVIENDFQPERLNAEHIEKNHSLCDYPKSVPLMNSSERMKCRQVKQVIRYHVPDKHTQPEKHAHHLLLMFYPFRDESDLCSQGAVSYVEKLNQTDVLAVVNANKILFEPYANLVDSALLEYHSGLSHNQDSYAQQENDHVEQELTASTILNDTNLEEEEGTVVFSDEVATSSNLFMSDDDINALIGFLNVKQRQVFEIINKWAREYVKNLNCKVPGEIQPLHLFLTGGAGSGKSHLIKTIYASLSKTLNFGVCKLDKPKVLLLAPTGVAAINISGTTIHSGLSIPPEARGKSVPKLSDEKRSLLRSKFSELKVIIIDEISMVSSMLLLYIHQRLIGIFGCSPDKLFAAITIILVGDLYQLPPIQQRPIFAEYFDDMLNIFPLWRIFKICELSEVMRQRGDNVLISLLNKIRIGTVDNDTNQILESRLINCEAENYPWNALHIFC